MFCAHLDCAVLDDGGCQTCRVFRGQGADVLSRVIPNSCNARMFGAMRASGGDVLYACVIERETPGFGEYLLVLAGVYSCEVPVKIVQATEIFRFQPSHARGWLLYCNTKSRFSS